MTGARLFTWLVLQSALHMRAYVLEILPVALKKATQAKLTTDIKTYYLLFFSCEILASQQSHF